MTKTQIDITLPVWPKQSLALSTPAQWKMFGGAAGGGKSYLLRVAAIQWALAIPGLQIFLFRRNLNELEKNHLAGENNFHVMLGGLIEKGLCEIVRGEIRFWNGSKIYICHANHVKDVYKWKGPELHVLLLEEATEFEEEQIRFLISRNRVPRGLIPKKYAHLFPMMLATTNPTGPSHSFWKNHFYDNKEPYKVWEYKDEDTVRTCAFIPSFLSDNPAINENEYKASLLFLKRPELIDAMLNGKWDIPLGAFLPELDEKKHLISPFEIPHYWFMFRTFDWGSQAPFHVQWWAVADGTFGWQQNGRVIPKKSLICYREWYGGIRNLSNRGLGLSNEQIAYGIKERTTNREVIQGTITDSKPFQANGALTIAQEFSRYGTPLLQGDVSRGSRVQGAQQLRSRLIGNGQDPLIFFFRSCPETWKCLTQIQTDPDNVEDANSDGDDHAYDATTLACKAKPYVRDQNHDKPKYLHEATMNDVLKQHFLNKGQSNGSRR
jgi:hypothetical protein